jgi:hypothetical protein
MHGAYRLTRKDGPPGIDGMTATDYEANLDANLGDRRAQIWTLHRAAGDGTTSRRRI